MFKKIFDLIKKIIFGFFLIYAFNKLGLSTNIVIPLNFVTVGLVSILGIPSLIMLVLFSVMYV